MLETIATASALLASAANAQSLDPHRYSDAARGLEITLFPDSFRHVGDDIRQGDFLVDITEQGSGLGTAIRMNGTVQVNCRTREARLVANRVVDARGESADALVGGGKAPTPWRGLADTHEDASLFIALCRPVAGEPVHPSSVSPPEGLISFDDYPARALREGREGTTEYRATFDERGVAIDCEIIASSGHADLDAATCKLVMRRARLAPVEPDMSHRYYESRVRWQIP